MFLIDGNCLYLMMHFDIRKFLYRLALLFIFVLFIGLAKWLLVWGENVKPQAIIFFGHNPSSSAWTNYLVKFLLTIGGFLILIASLLLGWLVVEWFANYGSRILGFDGIFFFVLPVCTIWFLNSFFIYNYVGVYSSSEVEGSRDTPTIIEIPGEVFAKSDNNGINKKIAQLENDEDYEDNVEKRRFLFVETALINGYYSRNHYAEGVGQYIYALSYALLEYIIVAFLYLFAPLMILSNIFIARALSRG